jgi:hypothetical protein
MRLPNIVRIVGYYALFFTLAISAQGCSSAAVISVPTDAPTPSFLPTDFSILPPFTPAYPCELQNVTMNDDHLCRYERVQEKIVGQDEYGLLIQRDAHTGQGCWSSINVDTHELRVCNRRNGQVSTLATHLVEYWTHTVYHGEELYLGPYIPPPSNDIWNTTVIPASETAGARGTYVPTPPSERPALTFSATATPTQSITPLP